MGSLQTELEQVLNNILEHHDHKRDAQSLDVAAILATVSKHLPEKSHIGKQYSTSTVDRLSYDLAYNTAITEMEKKLGGSV